MGEEIGFTRMNNKTFIRFGNNFTAVSLAVASQILLVVFNVGLEIWCMAEVQLEGK